MTINLLKKPIELLLKDEHYNVAWGETLPGISEVRRIFAGSKESETAGYLMVSFEDAPTQKQIESLLGEGEDIREGFAGRLTNNGYIPDSIHVTDAKKSKDRAVINFNLNTATMCIFNTDNGHALDQRALDILNGYYQMIIDRRGWEIRE